MNKTQLKQVTTILPFDEKYVKVGKGRKNIKWNLMDESGKLISSTWFSSLDKNSDGSLTTCVAKRKEKVEVKFINPASITSFDAAVKLVPASVISLVDTGTLEPYNMAGFVAKAKLYGQTVFIKKNGDIYNSNGTKLRLLFNTVDTERLMAAIHRFNKKMHYDYKPISDEYESDTFQLIGDNKISMFSFYFVTDEYSITSTFGRAKIQKGAKKWTDKFAIRIMGKLLSEDVKNDLNKKFKQEGTPYVKDESISKKWEPWTWLFEKDELDKVIAALDSF